MESAGLVNKCFTYVDRIYLKVQEHVQHMGSNGLPAYMHVLYSQLNAL